MPLSDQDADMVARTILSEAGNDGAAGMGAVANVIHNRQLAGTYGATPTDVVLARGQFEPWSLPRNNPNNPSHWSTKDPNYQSALSIANSVWNGDAADPTGGATHFFSPRDQAALGRNPPDWASGKPLASIGHHQFYAPNGRVMPDLLGSWSSVPPPATTTPAATLAPQNASQPDLLGSWSSAPLPPSPASMPILASLEAQHQGDSWGDLAIRTGAGIGKGFQDVADTLAEFGPAVSTAGANALARLGVISPDTAAQFAATRDRVNADVAHSNAAFNTATENSPSASVGRVGGQILGAAPFLAAGGGALGAAPMTSTLAGIPIVGTAATGALTGAGVAGLTSSTSDEPVLSQMGEGALTGGVIGPLGTGVSALAGKVLSPMVGQATQRLYQMAQQYGIPITAAQISENPTGLIRLLDSAMRKIPGMGYGATDAQQTAAVHRAMSNEMGIDTDQITQADWQRAKDQTSQLYDSAKARLGIRTQDLTDNGNRLVQIQQDANRVLAPQDARGINNVINDIMTRLTGVTPKGAVAPRQGVGMIAGDEYKAMVGTGSPLDRLTKSNNGNIGYYATQLENELDAAVRKFATRQGTRPGVGAQQALADLNTADRQWTAIKAMEPLVQKFPNGEFSAPQIAQAVNNNGPQTQAMSNIREVTQRFLREPPGSRTAESLLGMNIAGHIGGGALGAIGASAFDPEHIQRDAVLGAAGFGAARATSAALRSRWLPALLARGNNMQFPYIPGLGVTANAGFNTLPNVGRQSALGGQRGVNVRGGPPVGPIGGLRLLPAASALMVNRGAPQPAAP